MPVFCHSWCMERRCFAIRGAWNAVVLAIRDADTANAYFALAG